MVITNTSINDTVNSIKKSYQYPLNLLTLNLPINAVLQKYTSFSYQTKVHPDDVPKTVVTTFFRL